jgi:predicted lipoprotein with Yx(FWY)xxD motif
MIEMHTVLARLTPWLRRGLVIGSLALCLANAAAVSASEASVDVREDATLGTILTDGDGWTLYLYTRDAPGQSNCYDGCARAWPPLLTEGDPVAMGGLTMGMLGTTMRTDGTRQVTYNGWPLYYWQRDMQPGDTTGQNVGGVWFVLNPAPAPTVAVRTTEEHGPILTDVNGMTLYLYTRDAPGQSNCYDGCARAWPPLLAEGDLVAPEGLPGMLETTMRDDGGMQVTYNGIPLYYWQRDTQPGETTGQNVGGVWFVVNP